jgi:3-deoxy-D-manno-octulosonate 8-phosphate phosphatase (KDO 8-P phosphatase)
MTQSKKSVKWKKIKCLALDVDGVMTDGHIYLHEKNEWRRSFFIRDGLGLVQLRKLGFTLAVITNSRAEDIRTRVENLKIDHFYEGAENKIDAFRDLLAKTGLSANEIAYIGDDVIDLPVLEACGAAIAPSDAHELVLKKVDYKTKAPGGRGAIREICDLLIKNAKSNRLNFES